MFPDHDIFGFKIRQFELNITDGASVYTSTTENYVLVFEFQVSKHCVSCERMVINGVKLLILKL